MKSIIRFVCLSLLCFSVEVVAATVVPLNLSQSPIYLSNIPPNVFFLLDKSGSMNFSSLLPPFWLTCRYYNSPTTCSTTIDRGGDNPSGQKTTGDWREYSGQMNITYYDPGIDYSPWLMFCSSGTLCKDSNFFAAVNDPASSLSLTTNLSAVSGPNPLLDDPMMNNPPVPPKGSFYNVWIDDKGFTGSYPKPGAFTNGPNDTMDLWDSHVTVQFLSNGTVSVSSKTYNNPTANNLNLVTSTVTLSGAACYNVLGPASLVNQIFPNSLTSTGLPGCLTIAQAQQNYANFYTYYDTRLKAIKSALATIVTQFPQFKYAFIPYSNSSVDTTYFVPFPGPTVNNFSSQNATLLANVFKVLANGGTPTRVALDWVGQYYMGNKSGYTKPIYRDCQQNYTILMTDGFWNDSYSSIKDVDGDGYASTLADVARYYYLKNLNSNFKVVANSSDPAAYPHMVTFTMALGLRGYLVAGPDGLPTTPVTFSSGWGNPLNNDISKVDDLWHAAFNSYGQFFGAQTPVLTAQAIAGALNNITTRNVSGSPVAQNSTVLNIGSAIYQSVYNTTGWTGDVLAYALNTDGSLATTPLWSASCMLNGGVCVNPSGTNAGILPNNRVIFARSWTGANKGTAFRWPNDYLSVSYNSTQITNFLNQVSSQTAAQKNAYGIDLVNYLRGDHSKEIKNGGSFRNRISILGDIVDSSPVYVPAPYRFYPDTLESQPYSTFKTTNANRKPIVYVGANDGMLHGFDATTGLEVMAYVPGANQVYEALPNLSLLSYSHNFFSDATPTEGDVFYNGAWHTILVSALGNGGRTIYALDITDPSKFTEANASSVYLFEFSNVDSPDLGYVQGTPVIAKVRNGSKTQWAIIFGNGYNNVQADGTTTVSTTGKAALYILFIENAINAMNSTNPTWAGSFVEIPVGPAAASTGTPNGLATPFTVDVNQDNVVDYVYAGDLQGNMWKFDLTSTSTADWASNASVLFKTPTGQPITAPPVVGPHPNGLSSGVMVYFGTGKFLEPTDNSATGQTTQTFYGIWDKHAVLGDTTQATVPSSALVQQTIVGTATSTTGTFRLVSSNPINWNASTSSAPQNLGWYLNLTDTSLSTADNMGERQLSTPILRGDNVIFTTFLPTTAGCGGFGSSWLMELSSVSGGAPWTTAFDVNGDVQFDSSDKITVTKSSGQTSTGQASGMLSSVGATGTPAIMLSSDKSKETKILSGTAGLGTVAENPPVVGGRQNWRQINN